jgi:hypothetical protein
LIISVYVLAMNILVFFIKHDIYNKSYEKIDKPKIYKVLILTEQRYVKSKELIKESFGPTTDVDGVTDGLIGYYKMLF